MIRSFRIALVAVAGAVQGGGGAFRLTLADDHDLRVGKIANPRALLVGRTETVDRWAGLRHHRPIR